MIKSKFSIVLLSAIAIISVSGCKKDKCNAGTGGGVIVAAFPEHHGTVIYNQPNYPDTAYIKFCTKDFPGTDLTKYDLVVPGEIGEDHVHINGLQSGDYYIYMAGFDTSISQRVTGGLPFTIDQTGGEIDLTVPVTE